MSIVAAAEDILKTLVAFETVSSDSNEQLIVWIENYLDSHGVWHERVQENNQSGVKKTSLLARIGPDVPGGIVLSGHTDVVPVEGQVWHKTTPFALKEQDGNLYGRGASDMKGFLALALAKVPDYVKQNLKRPVWFAFSHDEEIGCKCAEPMAKEFIARKIEPQLILVGEPTSMRVVDEHKGIDSFETIITGKEAHSSAPAQGINAIDYMARLITVLNQIGAEEAAQPDPQSPYPTPYSTVHVGIANAGKARNIIPAHAYICWEVRPLPGVRAEDLIGPYLTAVERFNIEIKAKFPECGIVHQRRQHVHGLKKKEGAPYLELATYLAGSNESPTAVSYGTEGGAFGEHDFPTVICGPGSIDQAHQPDEYISREQFAKGAGMLDRVGEVLTRDL